MERYEAKALIDTLTQASYLSNVAWNLMQDSTTKQRYGVVEKHRIKFDESWPNAHGVLKRLKSKLEAE
ncbi:MAG: hypothetical protein EBU46_00200 [Nitrosomonadaceae bacterium]|nr:hypothetical protein [Nitrosomonadaceae bacterium]